MLDRELIRGGTRQSGRRFDCQWFNTLLLGMLAAVGLTRRTKSLLLGVGVTDPLTFVSLPLLLLGVALLACFLPARRAAKVDPIVYCAPNSSTLIP